MNKVVSNPDDTQSIKLRKFISIKDQPFLMLNLMQITDESQDKKYASNVVPLLHAVGGRARIIGTSQKYWKQVVFVYYPSTKALWDMTTSTNYTSGMFEMKEKSLKDTLILPTIPIYCHEKFMHGNMRNIVGKIKSKL